MRRTIVAVGVALVVLGGCTTTRRLVTSPFSGSSPVSHRLIAEPAGSGATYLSGETSSNAGDRLVCYDAHVIMQTRYGAPVDASEQALRNALAADPDRLATTFKRDVSNPGILNWYDAIFQDCIDNGYKA